MKKGLIPVTLGIAVTMAGLSVDANQSREKSFKLEIMQIWQVHY